MAGICRCAAAHLDTEKLCKRRVSAIILGTGADTGRFLLHHDTDLNGGQRIVTNKMMAYASRPHGTNLLDLQPNLCPGPERACLADGLGRDHSGQGDAAGRGREGFKRVEEIFAKFPITQT